MSDVYDKTIGYAAIDNVDIEKLSSKITIIKQILESTLPSYSPQKILVAGCGDGTEAVLIKKVFSGSVYGVDISLPVRQSTIQDCMLSRQDLRKMEFPDGFFDMVYNYHVLEHVSDPESVLKEFRRVLRPGGVLFIGFPNKNRLVGYIGSHNSVSVIEKIQWNLRDWKDRLNGKFENQLGAHAGFTEKEYIWTAKVFFDRIIPVRNEYMRLKYLRYQKVIAAFVACHIAEFIFPSNYYICQKSIS